MKSPVLFLIFNRPDSTAVVFAAIREAKPERLYVAADGPRADREGEAERCEEARRIATEVDWPCEVRTLFRDENLGCRRAVSGAITWFFEHEEEGIILEDDCVPHPSFFPYCETLLERYRDDERVMLVGGDNTLSSEVTWRGSYDFSRHALIWGWATWARAWAKYDFDNFVSSCRDPVLSDVFSENFAQLAWERRLTRAAEGSLNSWATPWLFTVWQCSGLAAVPATNLVSNIGFGEDATHTKGSGGARDARVAEEVHFPLQHPPIVANPELDAAITRDIHGIQRPLALHLRAWRKLKRLARRYVFKARTVDSVRG